VAKAIPRDPESDPARVRIARAALAAEQVGPNRASAIAVPLTSPDADVVRWYDKRETKEFGGKATSAAELSVRSGRIRAAVSGPGAGAALGKLAETYPFTGAHVDALGDASAPIVPVAPIPFAKEVEASARTILPSGGVGPANRFVQALTDAEFPVGPIRTAIEALFERSKLLLGGGAGARLRTTIMKVVVEGARAGLDVANTAVLNFLYGIVQDQVSEEGSDTGSRSNTQTVYRGEVDFDQHQVPERRRN
jgi:hypothetical protein